MPGRPGPVCWGPGRPVGFTGAMREAIGRVWWRSSCCRRPERARDDHQQQPPEPEPSSDIIAALWPERVKALVSVTGYLITNLEANKTPLSPAAENAWWYQYYFTTERGVQGLHQYKHELGEFIWKFNSPTWKFSTATYDRTAAAFENADYETIVIGNYRWRQSLLPAEPEYAELENKLQKAPKIAVPTITVDGRYDPFTPAGDGSSYRAHFTGKYRHRTFDVGHNVPQEAPREFAQAVVDADRL
jgi:pimeloyl-ACP methyl ester carboxylesterase